MYCTLSSELLTLSVVSCKAPLGNGEVASATKAKWPLARVSARPPVDTQPCVSLGRTTTVVGAALANAGSASNPTARLTAVGICSLSFIIFPCCFVLVQALSHIMQIDGMLMILHMHCK